jgi:hypothetical protein
MNWKRIGLGIVLADFAALNVYVVAKYGYAGFIELAFANGVTIAVAVDLVIALSLITAWMWRDARDSGRSFLPYAVLTMLFGSIGPLAYLIADPELSTAPRGAGTNARVDLARARG